MSIGLKQNKIFDGELCLKYDSYWRTWNRVLHMDVDWGGMVELNLTPINPHQHDSWMEQVIPIKIRAHRTALAREDKVFRCVQKCRHSVVYQKIKDAMMVEVPIILMHRLLNEDFLSQIDWQKYVEASVGGGGVPFALCKRTPT